MTPALLLWLAACGDGASVDVKDTGGDGPADTAPADTGGEADTADSATDTAADTGEDCPALDWYVDADGDGWGAGAVAVRACTSPGPGYADRDGDCDDADAGAHPEAQEVCGDGDDDDCDGNVDVSATPETWHPDDDGDGFGHMYNGETVCDPPAGWVLDATDCRPSDAEAHPGAEERCNDDDDDCDRQVDEGMDADGDGHRNDLCADGDDCDDADPTAFPGNPDDTCEDGVDQDCDGVDRPCEWWGEYALADVTKVHGGAPSDDAGRLVDAGDATGDGVPDLFVATYTARGYAGGGYLVPGPVTTSGAMDTLGYLFEGDARTTYGAGRSIGIGDVDGDGVADLGFGAPYSSTCGMYVVLGPIAADGAVDEADAVLLGPNGSYAGHGGDLADIDGDGIADAVVGAYNDDSGGAASGTVYLQYGPFDAEVDLASDADVILPGEGPSHYTGRHVHAGGDVDGDGVGDFLVAAPYATGSAPYSGIVYLVYGPGNVGDMSGADGRLLGESSGAYVGQGAALSIGDVDGDGLGDVAVGAMTDGTAGTNAGAAYVVFGPASGDVDLAAADVVVRGTAVNAYAGSASALGDADGDGLADLVVGAYSAAGAAYLFYAPAAGTYTTADAEAWFLGESVGDSAGTNALVADVTGDGVAEIVLGAPGESSGGATAGAVYVAVPAE